MTKIEHTILPLSRKETESAMVVFEYNLITYRPLNLWERIRGLFVPGLKDTLAKGKKKYKILSDETKRVFKPRDLTIMSWVDLDTAKELPFNECALVRSCLDGINQQQKIQNVTNRVREELDAD